MDNSGEGAIFWPKVVLLQFTRTTNGGENNRIQKNIIEVVGSAKRLIKVFYDSGIL